MSSLLFDRPLVKRRKRRFTDSFASVDFLYREAAERLADRLQDTTRSFGTTLLLGNHSELLPEILPTGKLGDITTAASFGDVSVRCDEEYLPFRESSFDAVISCLSLHWVNDLPGTLIQIQRALKPDGLFLAVLPGPQTLKELRQSLEAAMIEAEKGIYPVVSPFVEVRDAGNLLQRCGYALPVADSELLSLSYDTPFKLMNEIRLMGEANALVERRKRFSRRTLFQRTAEIYHQHHANSENRIQASVELVFLSGWKPHAGQPQPARRGSASLSLASALRESEH